MKNLLFAFSVILSANLFSQSDEQIFDKLVSNDSLSIPSLFIYNDSVRNAVLIASTYPQGFVRLSEIQKTSSAAFAKTISKYNQSKQKQLWEITRYPGLTSLLIQNKDKSEKELGALLKHYPEKIISPAIYFTKKKYSTLADIDNIHSDFEAQYKNVIIDFPDFVKNSFNILLNYPDLLTILSENMKTTVTLGDLYKRNPQMIKRKVDSLNTEIAKENGIEYEDWKKGISNDTAVQKELKQISKKYSSDLEADDVYDGDDYDENIIIELTPYPYWAGYPYWYGHNYWYPNPWWFQLGFYWPLDGGMIFFGLPTYHFGWWYYNQPRYYSKHPDTSDYFYQHYQRHRNSNSGFNRSTRESYRRRRR